MSNLSFIPTPANSDIFIEMRDNYVRVSSLLHSVTSCSSDTVSVEKSGDYYYIDKSTLNDDDFVLVNIDYKDSNNDYNYTVDLSDKSLILISINYTVSETLEIPSTYLGRQVKNLSSSIFVTTDTSNVKTLILPDSLTTVSYTHLTLPTIA